MPVWFKLHHEMLRDKKLRLMARELDVQEALVRGLWIDLLCFAHELDQDWNLRLEVGLSLSRDDIFDELGADRETCARFFDAAIKYQLVDVGSDGDGWRIAGGDARNQKPSDSPEAWRERKAKSREESREESRGSHAGHEKMSRRDVTRQKEREEKKERSAGGRATDAATSPARAKGYCECGAQLQPDGDGTDSTHCPICEPAVIA